LLLFPVKPHALHGGCLLHCNIAAPALVPAPGKKATRRFGGPGGSAAISRAQASCCHPRGRRSAMPIIEIVTAGKGSSIVVCRDQTRILTINSADTRRARAAQPRRNRRNVEAPGIQLRLRASGQPARSNLSDAAEFLLERFVSWVRSPLSSRPSCDRYKPFRRRYAVTARSQNGLDGASPARPCPIPRRD